MDIWINLLLVAFVTVSLLLILVVLMQRPKQEGLGAAFGSGMTDQMFGANTTTVLQKGTAYFGTAFLLLALILSILISKRHFEKGITETSPPATDPAMAPVPQVDPEGGNEAEDQKDIDAQNEALKRALEAIPKPPVSPATPNSEAGTTPAPGEPAPEEPAPEEPAPEQP